MLCPIQHAFLLSWSVLINSFAQAQTSSASSADGLNSLTSTSSASIGTATINGTPTTYRNIFTVPAAADSGVPVIPNIEDPQAVDAQSVCPGYSASNVVRNAYGFSAILNLAGPACNLYGTDIETLDLTVQYQSGSRLSVKITPSNIAPSETSWYILPNDLVQEPTLDADANYTSQASDLQFSWSNDPTFGFSVIRKSTGDVLFDTTGNRLIFENQFIEFSSGLPEEYNLYGLGEHIHGLRLGNNFTATMYAADVGDPIDDNIYGTHPFYLDTRYYEQDPSSGNLTLVTSNETDPNASYVSYSHGVYLRNAHGHEILLKPENVTWRTLGGSIDLYFFDGPSQPEVTANYQEAAIGLPAMQQYFAFGYHQCRWGYRNWTELSNVVNNFRQFDIPLENIWTDIDYMNQYRDYDNDQNRFSYPEGEQFLSQLHANGQHYIPIVDSAIYVPNPSNASDAYGTYTRGNDSGVFMMNPDGSQYIGNVWPGYTVFPDWLSDKAVPWWTDEMVMWHDKVAFDGIWIDMSEVSSFCVGSCGSGNITLNPVHPPFALPGEPGNVIYDYPEDFNVTNATQAASAASASSSQAAATSATAGSTVATSYVRTTPTPGVRNVNYPPYTINNVQGDLAVHAVSPNATHHNGVQEYDVHNLFGYQILNATYQALVSVFPGKRPLIIGRSTFAGAGKWAGHWGGDNYSQWRYMYFSIPQALSFALFGIPMFGVDTCGFNGNSDEELCNRWMQLSAFFPFYRNHNTFSADPQEPYVWSSVIDASKTAMAIRYSILPYMYTLFHQAHTTGSTVMRALSWEFPTEPSLASADRQFLLGSSLLVTPVLEPLATTVDGVFPGVKDGTVWYDWYNQTAVDVPAGANVTIDAPLGHIPLYVRGGSVMPMQEPGYTTAESRKNPWALLTALDQEGSATGQLYVDDGESIEPTDTLLVDFTATQGSLYASARGTYNDTNALANVTVLGVENAGNSVTLNGKTLSSGVQYDGTNKILKVTGLNNMTSTGAWSQDWVLSWS
ncbi:glycoside hydrolase family 31 protein [Viridothelium virens]|uniref:Alpha-glucosidase n=1 Tax=Viridothelium virens TaxID=1048519 RepID=A0A6A6GYL8_VIRVR|nr:glycoside hydrolase family 31 protein [Viridothelium virens]